ncbi:MAG: hypothetical protein FGM28_07550 [Limnohabitans sp.]|nr:hypothetical protein [Limnohabitans sp.]
MSAWAISMGLILSLIEEFSRLLCLIEELFFVVYFQWFIDCFSDYEILFLISRKNAAMHAFDLSYCEMMFCHFAGLGGC